MQWIHVAVGGAMGALARFGIHSGMAAIFPSFPWGTAMVNIVGSFLAGLVFAMMPHQLEPYRNLVMVGFLGAFTTMSAFALEVVVMIQNDKLALAAIHWTGGALICIVACWLGLKAGHFIPN